MLLFLLLAAVVIVPVARWAWRFQRRAQHLAALGLIDMVGRPGKLVDVTLAGLLREDDVVLAAFRPVGMAAGGNNGRPLPPPTTLMLSVREQDPSSVARLERWHAGVAHLLLWRQRDGRMVELTQIHTGHQVRLPVLTEPGPSGTDDDRGSAAGPIPTVG